MQRAVNKEIFIGRKLKNKRIFLIPNSTGTGISLVFKRLIEPGEKITELMAESTAAVKVIDGKIVVTQINLSFSAAYAVMESLQELFDEK